LYVGIGNVNTDPALSHSIYTSINISFINFISSSNSPNFFSYGPVSNHPSNKAFSFRSGGQTQSKVIFVKGVCVHHLLGTFNPNIKFCICCFVYLRNFFSTNAFFSSSFSNFAHVAFNSSNISLLLLCTKGDKYVSNELNACAPAHSFCNVPKKFIIWFTADCKFLGGADCNFPSTPLNHSSNKALKLRQAQYGVNIHKSCI